MDDHAADPQPEQRFRSLLEGVPVSAYRWEAGQAGRCLYVSPQIEAMLGFPVSDWLNEGFYASRVHPDDCDRVLAEVERTHLTGEDFRLEYRLIAADGRVVWVLDETVAVRDGEYRPILLQGFLVDITARIERAAPRPALRAAAS